MASALMEAGHSRSWPASKGSQTYPETASEVCTEESLLVEVLLEVLLEALCNGLEASHTSWWE